MSSSIPQFNLREINAALATLLLNPDCSFDDIYCVPDFATGGILLNADEVKESLRTGNGRACHLRSVIEFDNAERCLIVKEIPYSVYTNTICRELESILEGEENPGIDRFNDLTGENPFIKIYLSKRANPDKVLKYLYKNTSLQSHYSVNMTMLDNGRYPKVFNWREALEAHIAHEKEVYKLSFLFDLNKMETRLHIINGLLRAIDAIDEVIKTIRVAADTKTASVALQKLLAIDEAQAKAILDIRLARLAHLEVNKLSSEKSKLEGEILKISTILENEELFNQELVNGWGEVAKKLGDERRTQVLNLNTKEEEDEPIEVKSLLVSLTNQNNLVVSETSSLYTQKRGGVGSKFKLESGEYILSSVVCENIDTLLLFTTQGQGYSQVAGDLSIGERIAIESLFSVSASEEMCGMTALTKNAKEQYIIFITKNGILKKSRLSEYNIRRNKTGTKAITLDAGDEIQSVLFTNEERIGIVTEQGNFLLCETSDIRPIGRVAKGVIGIRLNDGDFVSSAKMIPTETREIMSVSGEGLIKRTLINEFTVQGRATKGSRIQRVSDSDWIADFLPIQDEKEITVVSTSSQIKLSVSDISLLSKNTLGAKSIKKKTKDNIISLVI